MLPHSTAVGKVLLADRADAACRLQADRPAPADRAHDHHRDRLLAELRRVRERGYAMDLGEEELGVHCLAVPVRGRGRGRSPRMSVSGPAERINALDRDELAEGLRKIAHDFGAELGPGPADGNA